MTTETDSKTSTRPAVEVFVRMNGQDTDARDVSFVVPEGVSVPAVKALGFAVTGRSAVTTVRGNLLDYWAAEAGERPVSGPVSLAAATDSLRERLKELLDSKGLDLEWVEP